MRQYFINRRLCKMSASMNRNNSHASSPPPHFRNRTNNKSAESSACEWIRFLSQSITNSGFSSSFGWKWKQNDRKPLELLSSQTWIYFEQICCFRNAFDLRLTVSVLNEWSEIIFFSPLITVIRPPPQKKASNIGSYSNNARYCWTGPITI